MSGDAASIRVRVMMVKGHRLSSTKLILLNSKENKNQKNSLNYFTYFWSYLPNKSLKHAKNNL